MGEARTATDRHAQSVGLVWPLRMVPQRYASRDGTGVGRYRRIRGGQDLAEPLLVRLVQQTVGLVDHLRPRAGGPPRPPGRNVSVCAGARGDARPGTHTR